MMSKVFAYILEPVSATNKSIMPKRDAANELNHDNWDQEDESEEAGEFKRATDDQMKVNEC